MGDIINIKDEIQKLRTVRGSLKFYMFVTELSDITGLSRDWIHQQIKAGHFKRNKLTGKLNVMQVLEYVESFDVKPRYKIPKAG